MRTIWALLIDDNVRFLRAASKFLEKQKGISVVGSIDKWILGLRQSRTCRPEIVLLDLAMPELQDLKLLPHLRNRISAMGIIVLSIMDATAYRETVLALAADAIVSKRTVYDDLVPAIRRVAKVRRPWTSAPIPRKPQSMH